MVCPVVVDVAEISSINVRSVVRGVPALRDEG